MARYLVIVESTCRDPDREVEFNEWYDTVHVPDILDEPGTVSVTRWLDTAAQSLKYVTLVEVESDDIDRTLSLQRENAARLEKAGRLSALFTPVSRRVLRKIGP